MKKIVIILGIGVLVCTAFITISSGYLKYLDRQEMYFISNDKYELHSSSINTNLSVDFLCQDGLEDELANNIVDGSRLNIVGCQIDSEGVYVQFEIINESTFAGGAIISLDTLDGTSEMVTHPDIFLNINGQTIQGKMVSSGPFDGAQNYGLFFSNDSNDGVLAGVECNINFRGFVFNDFVRRRVS